MFTGIVKGLGTIVDVKKRDAFLDIVVNVGEVLSPSTDSGSSTEVGASVAIDGVCLTVVAIEGDRWTFSLMQETLEKTTVGERKVGDRVCLEQPMRMGDEFGGHMVLGHVDGVGTIVEKEINGENCRVTIEAPELFVKYIVQKGSIAIDGVSLTVCDPENPRLTKSSRASDSELVEEEGVGGGGIRFSVSLLPLTLERTTLGFKNVGEKVNLEADYFLKAMVR